MAPPLNSARLFDTLEEASRVGRWRETGVRRLALDDADRQMRDLFRDWCLESGLEVSVDRAGNMFAARVGSEQLPPVMIGSHLDTQVAGGRYDGSLGVLTGLEIVRSLSEHQIVTRRPIVVCNWTDEEGARFQPPMLGSSAYTGATSLEVALTATDLGGRSFGDELARIGYAGPQPVPGPKPAAYIEFHIEQGDVLDLEGFELGIVTSAFASQGTVLRFRGETGHAGATPMRKRRDPLVAASEFVTAAHALIAAYGDEARLTVPSFEVWPNRPGIIAGEVTLTVDVRHSKALKLQALAEKINQSYREIGERHQVEVTIEQSWGFGGELEFDHELIQSAHDAAQQLGVSRIEMQSAAGHDAYELAKVAPALILFVPCVDGISHNEHEDIRADAVVRGASVLANVVLEAAQR